MWDSMICVVLKKNYFMQPLLKLLLWKKITNWIFKKPIETAQSQHSTIENTYCKTSCFNITALTLGRQMSNMKVEVIEGEQRAIEDVPKK